jgi:hypothetical protein
MVQIGTHFFFIVMSLRRLAVGLAVAVRQINADKSATTPPSDEQCMYA